MTAQEGLGQITELEADEILRALVEHEVEFLVIGALAVAVHGYPRATKDVDVVPRPGPTNAERLFAALTAIGAHPIEIGDLRAEEMRVEFGPSGLAHDGNWALRTQHGRVDVMQWVPGIGGYEQLEPNAFVVDLRGVGTVRFAGYEDVVAMKAAAGRRQDEEDLARLREARGEA